MLPGSKTRDEQHGQEEAWREQVEQAWNQQGEDRTISGIGAEPYVDFLESMFFYYGENVRAAERASVRG
jgi:hypothetical protein